MSGNLIKGLLCFGGFGGICGGTFLVAKSINTNTKTLKIKDKLIAQGYQILDFKNTSSKGWERIKSAYLEASSARKRFSNVEVQEGKIISGVKNNCLQLLEKSEITEDEYSKVKIWCVVPITVESKFSPEALLKYGAEDTSDNSSWNKLAKKHWDNSTNAELRISKEEKTSEEDRRTEIKLKCSEGLKVDSINDLFNDTIAKVNDWCTKESASKISD